MSTSPQPEGPASPAHPAAPSPLPAAIAYYPPPPPRRRGFFGRLLVSLFMFIFLASLFMNFVLAGFTASVLNEGRVQEKFVSHDIKAKDKIAILPIEGIILESEDGFVKRAIDTAIEDEHVKAIVLRVDSPGGSVSGSDYIYHHLRELVKKRNIPIVVSMGGIAASGGYYVSMAVGDVTDTIYAEPTGFTGSIGVIIPHYNVAGLMDQYKVVDDSIASNPLKEMGSITKPMSKAEKDIFQKLVDESFAHFKKVVCEGRPMFKKDTAALDKLATGRIYTAEQAAKNGLVDKLGFVEDAVDRAIELAHLDKDKVKVVRYKMEPGLSSVLLGSQSRSSASLDLKTLLDITTPRAYYLVSWLPGLTQAGKQEN
jgi:protease-4